MLGFKFYRILFICIFVCVAIAGTVNLTQRRGFGIEVTEENGEVIVASIEPEGAAGLSGIRAGDVLHSIASYEMANPAQADWYLKGVTYESGVEFEIKRNNEPLSIYVDPSPSFSWGFIILNLILGLRLVSIIFTLPPGYSLIAWYLLPSSSFCYVSPVRLDLHEIVCSVR
jgi:membrane-associated protease RseP (regulator of RpoE activity)